jgi:tetratricopeptide (TPR) repeat protein
MTKSTLLLCLLLTSFTCLLAQKGKDKNKKSMTDEEAKSFFEKLNMDSATVLRRSAQAACQCVDSVDRTKNDRVEKTKAVAGCIDVQASALQMAVKLLNSLKNPSKEITINVSNNSSEYQSFYFSIERWLKDSCRSVNKILMNNDDIMSEKSLTENEEAKAAYSKGQEFLRKEDYAGGIPWFEKAVAIDPEFAFAWDNLGICYRKTNNLEKAEAAYKASLKVDPKGKTPLQNLPVVYQLQNKPDEAIETYNKLLEYYPGDPEVYYGVAIVYFNYKQDMEKALDNMCKAYNIYIENKSPYRSDAEKIINKIYARMKADNKEDAFKRILKENNITAN